MNQQTNQPDPDEPLVHICEVCGVEEILLPQQAFDSGWDYPPRMGAFGILSPRTCGDCGIDRTLWWRLMVEKVDPSSLSAADLTLIERIKGEPESIRPKEDA